MNIPEQKKKYNYTNIVESAKTSFGHSLSYKKLYLKREHLDLSVNINPLSATVALI